MTNTERIQANNEELRKSIEMAENLPDAGDGGYDEGYADGEKAEYDRFWEACLRQKTNWSGRFAGKCWNDETFNPPGDIVPTGTSTQMFWMSAITDLQALLDKNGVVLDTSKVTGFSQFFGNSTMTRVGIIDTRASASLSNIMLTASNMATVDKIILKPDGSQTFSKGFDNMQKLQNIVFEGVIGQAISFPNSGLLTAESVQSIIDHLKDLTGQTAQTLTFHADVGGALTAEQKAAITAKNWTLVY